MRDHLQSFGAKMTVSSWKSYLYHGQYNICCFVPHEMNSLHVHNSSIKHIHKYFTTLKRTLYILWVHYDKCHAVILNKCFLKKQFMTSVIILSLPISYILKYTNLSKLKKSWHKVRLYYKYINTSNKSHWLYKPYSGWLYKHEIAELPWDFSSRHQGGMNNLTCNYSVTKPLLL